MGDHISMADCPHIDGCEMYEAFRISSTVEVWQNLYCRATFAGCERYKRATAGLAVDRLLLPNGRLLQKGRISTPK